MNRYRNGICPDWKRPLGSQRSFCFFGGRKKGKAVTKKGLTTIKTHDIIGNVKR
jgi:hypothetical protein